LWLDETRAQLESDRVDIDRLVDTLIRDDKITAEQATSMFNDSGYAFPAMRNLIDVARELYASPEAAVADVERMISLEDEDLRPVVERTPETETASQSGSG
jgi:phosphate:Na+ symporter